jgi:hypothetical protein
MADIKDDVEKYAESVDAEVASIRPAITEEQDLGISKIARPDRSWSRTQPVQLIPSKERLDADHQVVTISNISDREPSENGKPRPQDHVVVDRFLNGHTLQPGQTLRDIDMLASDIAYFQRERMSNRFDNRGIPKPKHPIVISGISSKVEKRPVTSR